MNVCFMGLTLCVFQGWVWGLQGLFHPRCDAWDTAQSGRGWDSGVFQLSAGTSKEIPQNPLTHPYCWGALE